MRCVRLAPTTIVRAASPHPWHDCPPLRRGFRNPLPLFDPTTAWCGANWGTQDAPTSVSPAAEGRGALWGGWAAAGVASPLKLIIREAVPDNPRNLSRCATTCAQSCSGRNRGGQQPRPRCDEPWASTSAARPIRNWCSPGLHKERNPLQPAFHPRLNAPRAQNRDATRGLSGTRHAGT